MAKGINHYTITLIDFDDVLSQDDAAAIQRVAILCQMSKKRLFPRNVTPNAFQVKRTENTISVRALVAMDGRPEQIIAVFKFVPPPRF